MIGASNAAEKFMPATGLGKAGALAARATAYGVPAALLFNEYERYAEQAKDPTETQANRDAARQISMGILGAGTGIGTEGAARFALAPRDEGQGKAVMRIAPA